MNKSLSIAAAVSGVLASSIAFGATATAANSVGSHVASGYVGNNVTLLGSPTGNETGTDSGGFVQTFQRGALFRKSMSTPTYAVVSPMYNAYVRSGTVGSLGFPTSNPTTISYGYAQTFEKSAMTSNGLNSGTAWLLNGETKDLFVRNGGMRGTFGIATGSANSSWNGHNVRWFSTGMIDTTNDKVVLSGIGRFYRSAGIANTLKTPTGNEVVTSDGAYQTFTGGRIYWEKSSGRTAMVKGGILTKFLANGGTSKFGYPVSTERYDSKYGWVQQFTKGTFYYNTGSLTAPGGTTTTTPPASNAWKPASQYVQPVTRAITSGTGYTLSSGMNGVKVYLVQQALGIPYSPMNSTMGPTTTAKVKAFQSRHGLVADGIVGPATFAKLGTGYSFNVDAWKQGSNVSTSATRDQRVNAMIAFAKAQLGKPYIWGGTGPMGYDCSGLMLQAMRAGGVDPRNVSNYTDVRPASDLSNQMMRDSEFQKGSLSNLKPGDFIYYGGSDGVAHHVSMYIGNGQIINAAGNNVYITSSSNTLGWSRMLGTNRAFAL